MNEERLQGVLEALMPEAIRWLRRLVEVNSFTANREGVIHVASLTAEMFAELGFEAEFADADNPRHGQHVFLWRDGGTKRQPIVLVTHSDTVFPPEEEEQNHFCWSEVPSEKRIYGPGTVDNKGGTVLIWLMLRALRDTQPDLFESTSWLVASNANEEVIAGDFARETTSRCPHCAQAVLVFEGGPRTSDEFQIVTARKGRMELRIHAEGKAAHAGSNHREGANAVVALAAALPEIAALTDYEHDLTVNLATIHGGTVLNRVPHEAVAELEMRAYDPETLRYATETIASICHRHSGMVRLTVESIGSTAAWPQDERTMKLFQHWGDAASAMGLRALATKRGGLSDANYLRALGPLLDGLGPSGANAHCSIRRADSTTLPEYVEPDSFVPKAMMNILAMTRLLNSGRTSC